MRAAKLDAVTAAALAAHVAETYVSKAGLREQTEQIRGALRGVSDSLAYLNSRIDSVIEGRPSARPRKPAY